MFWYVLNRNKKWFCVFALIVVFGILELILSQLIYKFIGFIIDFGLGYDGEGYAGGIWSFLFTGDFGGYGSLKLIVTLAICVVLCAFIVLLAFVSSMLCWKIMHDQNHRK